MKSAIMPKSLGSVIKGLVASMAMIVIIDVAISQAFEEMNIEDAMRWFD